MKRRNVLAAAALGSIAVQANAAAGAASDGTAVLAGWQLRWAPEASVHGLDAFEGVEDDRADSHPAGQPHIFVPSGSNDYRFNMHMVDRDSMTDRQRQEVKGMVWQGASLILLPGETWKLAHSLFIPIALKSTTSFTHIMQTKAPGTDSLPMITMSLRRVDNVQKIELVVSGVRVGLVDLVPLQNKWIDVELEMEIGDSARVRWVVRDGATTVIDVTKTGLDTFLEDRVRPKWGIYRSLGDTSGSLQDCFMLIRNLRCYKWSESGPPPSGTRYEAENATISQGVVESNWPGFTGTGFVNLDNVVGSFVQWSVNAPAPSMATLTFRYANGTTATRPMDIFVNGALVADELGFIPTPAWDDWDTRTVTGVRLSAGANTVRATSTTSSGGPNLDHLEVQTTGPAPVDYQAESATISQGAVESNHDGFTGSGFANVDNVVGSFVQFAVTGPATSLAIRFANGTTTARPMALSIDGGAGSNVDFPSTGIWTTWDTVTVPVSMSAGSHTVRLTSSTANGGPNLDKITLS